MEPKIFDQRQIKRAVELGLGAASPSEIRPVSADDESKKYCERVMDILNQG